MLVKKAIRVVDEKQGINSEWSIGKLVISVHDILFETAVQLKLFLEKNFSTAEQYKLSKYGIYRERE